MEWLEALDPSRALRNCQTDIAGDWYRDPWGWPEAEWVVNERPDLLLRRLNGDGVARAWRLDVVKENFSIRPAIVMDPIDRLAYQALVDRLSLQVGKGLRPWVYGWRLPRDEPKRGHYRRNDREWEDFVGHLSSASDWFEAALKTDISSYFASVQLDELQEQLHSRVRTNRVVQRLMSMLRAWSSIPGRSGLPQRSAASAALANMYLSTVDDVADHYGSLEPTRNWMAGTNAAALRWMDDYWVFGSDEAVLRRCQVEMQDALNSLGLLMNSAKTTVLTGETLVIESKEAEHSAVDNALVVTEEEDIDVGPLNELVDRLLAAPEVSSRTSVRFATTRMRWFERFERVDDFVEQAERMPHASDHLARLFRKSGAWRDLGEWYVDYAKSDWSTVDWSAAQFGTMFPTSEIEPKVRDYWLEEVSRMGSLPTVAVAVQRLTSWAADDARYAIREAARKADHPLERRTLALAALEAGEERRTIRTLLREFEENSVTLEMIEDRSFRPIRAVQDFTG